MSLIIPTKKLKSGFQLPVYGLGTRQMGGRNERDATNDDQADIAAIQLAIEKGVRHIDTAESYADGYTETLVGKAIQPYDRQSLFLTSKVHSSHLEYQQVIDAAQASLRRLQTDYLDLYLIHRYNIQTPLAETFRALDELLAQGLIRNIGVSNFPVEKMVEAQSLTKNKIVCNQVHYNLQYREVEKEGVVEYCQKNDILLVAWRPLQKGMLTAPAQPIVVELAKKYGKTPAQIALNWLITQDNVVTLSKTTTPEHLVENLGALDWALEAQDIEKLRVEFPNQQAVSDAVPLHYSQ